LIGQQISIRPKKHDDWTVVPNIWGAIIGSPGTMKTPGLYEALKSIQELERLAAYQHKQEMNWYNAESIVIKHRKKNAEREFSERLKKKEKGASIDIVEEPEKPIRKRYLVNDPTVEKLGELLNENPNGVLLFRDELTGFIRNLDRQGREAERAFYLESWNGKGRFTYDRIGRGTIDIENACVSILGGIQPGPLTKYLRVGKADGVTDDGLLQRFQLMVWPDDPGPYQEVDRLPDAGALENFQTVVSRLANLFRRQSKKTSKLTCVSFDSKALRRFQEFREQLESRIRDNDEHPLIRSHISKYRSLIPSLALIIQVIDSAQPPKNVGLPALNKAIGWADYLETHARRVYFPAMFADLDAAHLLLGRIRRRNLPESFSIRDVYRHQWSGLTDPPTVKAAIALLEEFDWLRCRQESTAGRSREIYEVNPKTYGSTTDKTDS
jgi:putative DNA primase/helicase